jgi:hypothetical protein
MDSKTEKKNTDRNLFERQVKKWLTKLNKEEKKKKQLQTQNEDC